MDMDVVPGSVTGWTVTAEDQRRLGRAFTGLRLRSMGFWFAALVLPPMVVGTLWFAWPFSAWSPVGDPFRVATAAICGGTILVVQLVVPLWTVRRAVRREFPVGAVLTAWATASGLGVRTSTRMTFYPWSRLTRADVGPVLVRCRQPFRRYLIPSCLPAGPDELAGSIDFPAALVGPVIRRELEAAGTRGPAKTPLLGVRIEIDRAMRRRLVRAWLLARFGLLSWLTPAVFSLNVVLFLATGFYRGAIYWAVLIGMGPLIRLFGGEGRMTGMYPLGATIVGSVGESLEIQGPWGSVAWHHGWLKLRRMTKHTVTYEVTQLNADGSPAELSNGEKRIVVIPRAFLDTPTPAVGAEV
ncbi:hypothetical protein ACIRON_25065 [Nocardioides sp. NPDC101246]|uniref:hypothetical protein n=1 Tax=Nocardioides sp. NPDC101246 TaxID=3364336 RepID=UPI00382B6464